MDDTASRLEQADRLALITQKIGFTLWQIQELEGVSATYFTLVEQSTKGMGQEAGSVLEEKAKKKTFGATIHKLTKAGLLSLELESRFNHILSERNWLVHKSRSESRDAIHSDHALQRLLIRLKNIADESLSILQVIGELSETYARKNGVAKESIDSIAKQLLEQWHQSSDI